MATIAAAFIRSPVIVRMSDFKSNEYRKLLGGEIYEPEEPDARLPVARRATSRTASATASRWKSPR